LEDVPNLPNTWKGFIWLALSFQAGDTMTAAYKLRPAIPASPQYPDETDGPTPP
jgi:hypothetical protein